MVCSVVYKCNRPTYEHVNEPTKHEEDKKGMNKQQKMASKEQQQQQQQQRKNYLQQNRKQKFILLLLSFHFIFCLVITKYVYLIYLVILCVRPLSDWLVDGGGGGGGRFSEHFVWICRAFMCVCVFNIRAIS